MEDILVALRWTFSRSKIYSSLEVAKVVSSMTVWNKQEIDIDFFLHTRKRLLEQNPVWRSAFAHIDITWADHAILQVNRILWSLCSLTQAIILFPTEKDDYEYEGYREICMVVHLKLPIPPWDWPKTTFLVMSTPRSCWLFLGKLF